MRLWGAEGRGSFPQREQYVKALRWERTWLIGETRMAGVNRDRQSGERRHAGGVWWGIPGPL